MPAMDQETRIRWYVVGSFIMSVRQHLVDVIWGFTLVTGPSLSSYRCTFNCPMKASVKRYVLSP